MPFSFFGLSIFGEILGSHSSDNED